MREPFTIPSPSGGARQNPTLREADCRFALGDFDEALPLYRQAWDQAGDDPALRGEIASALSDCLANLGELDEALAWADHAIASFRRGGGKHRIFLARERRAFYLSWAGRTDMAIMEVRQLVSALRRQAKTDISFRVDLGRGLDHLAEVLERGHRLEEAARAAMESTALRREADDPIEHLQSLITLTRLQADLGRKESALALCDEMGSLLANEETLPIALQAQTAAIQGLVLMAMAREREAEPRLMESAHLLRRLAREGDGSAIFRDALAEVLLDLGRHHLANAPLLAARFFSRAAAWKRRIERDAPHPFHRAGFAASLVCLGRAELGAGWVKKAKRHFDQAIAIFVELEPVPAGFTEAALRLTEALTQRAADPETQTRRFRLLAETFGRAVELTDVPLFDTASERQHEFQRLWLEHFIDRGNALGVLAVLAFAHGQRLARLAWEERRCSAAAGASEEELNLLRLRRDLMRLDMERAAILDGLFPRQTGGVNFSLEQYRRYRYRDYLRARDRLTESGSPFPAATPWPEAPPLPGPEDPALTIWCVPEALGVARRPKVILFIPGEWKPRLLPVPELIPAHAAYERFLARLPLGRAGLRGSVPEFAISSRSEPEIPDAQDLWRWMNRLWAGLQSVMPGTDRIDLVTHAQAHNLPWLGSCPDCIRLRQFPSLHFLAGRDKAQSLSPPSVTNPLLLSVLDNPDSPRDTLYFAALERTAIRLVWPGSVLEDPGASLPLRQPIAALWFIGHGLNDGGQPLFGVREPRQAMAVIPQLTLLECPIGLIYASTCYLGQTTDVEGEPVGLPGLAALRQEPPLTAGAVAPVDDFSTAIQSFLFHWFWRETGDARQAFRRAREAMGSGHWPFQALALLGKVRDAVEPGIRRKASHHALIGREEIARKYPGLSRRQQLELQYRIRQRARVCLNRLDLLAAPRLPARLSADREDDSPRLWALLG